MNYLDLHQQYKAESLFGRYITLEHIEPLLSKYPTTIVGYSVLGKPLYQLLLGSGKTKIFMWSQMHGNEGTTTKALFDFLNFLHSNTKESEAILNAFTFCLLPMLNPDGAELYTRENANSIDLNRDAQDLSQPESKVLRQVFETFQPDYCYNLHDQRTIFGVADSGHPATVSFLAPAYNDSRDINDIRIKAMNVIVAMNEVLQTLIPNQVGRFDDSFNINCVGDTFQYLKVPTVLFEAGHFPNDYEREETRKYIFVALVSGIQYFYENDIVDNKNDDYLKIPQNKVVFYDFVYKNVKINYDSNEKIINFAAQYKEVLNKGKVSFEARIAQIDNLESFFGHIVFDAHGETYHDDETNFPKIEQKADFYLGKNTKIVNGLIKN
ncbi:MULTISPECIES: M14 family metallopeptidase [unclassified Flavobacterium]|uniref:M14 family metallopeptidase n=1 Tax=unclassified Flavobacterium TaxID=196869 RepID=UPI000EB26726|nr:MULTISPECIES: M14 metallopeptidase family protein [unclassified Flavobacterium]RKS02380.1 zinc carboxypeptidase [Flavobacterium sp. 102]